jgi:hypothetical protein
MGKVRALRLSGRLRVMVATWPATSYRTSGMQPPADGGGSLPA